MSKAKLWSSSLLITLKKSKSFLNIPVHLCDFVIRNKFFPYFRFYIYLKSWCDGQIKICPNEKRQIAKELQVSYRTIENYLTTLVARNWVGYNPASGFYFIRGFDKIKQLEKLAGRRGAWLSVSKDILDDKRFKAFVISASIGHLANTSKWKERCKRGSDHFKGRSNHNLSKHLPSHYPIACEAMAKIYNISTSTASLHKALAAKHEFVQIRKTFEKITWGEAEKDFVDEFPCGNGIDAEYAPIYKKAFPETAHRVRIRDGKLYLEGTDMVRPCLEFTKRWRPSRRRQKNNKLHVFNLFATKRPHTALSIQ